MVPSALQNEISVQLVAAGHAVGGKIGSDNSSLPVCGGFGRRIDGLLLAASGLISGDFSSSPLSGGKYAPTGLFPCGTSLSGGRYPLLTCGFLVITCGRGV